MKTKTPKIIRVVWTDATSNDAWTEEDQIEPELHRIVTIGHLQQETKEALVVALSHDPAGKAFSSFISIPKAWIESRQYLQTKSLKRRK